MFGERKYSAKYDSSHPGDNGAFGVVIGLLLMAAAVAYLSIGQ